MRSLAKQLQLALRKKSLRYQETNKSCQVNFDEINTENLL